MLHTIPPVSPRERVCTNTARRHNQDTDTDTTHPSSSDRSFPHRPQKEQTPLAPCSDAQPPEPRDTKCLLFQPLSPWRFVTAAPADSYMELHGPTCWRIWFPKYEPPT